MSFDCKCGCGLGIQNMDAVFLVKLETAQRISMIRYSYNSAIRCEKHNKDTRGSKTSSHLKGLAVDIRTENSRERFLVLDGLFKAGFTRIGIYSTFIHVDYDLTKDQKVTWYRR